MGRCMGMTHNRRPLGAFPDTEGDCAIPLAILIPMPKPLIPDTFGGAEVGGFQGHKSSSGPSMLMLALKMETGQKLPFSSSTS